MIEPTYHFVKGAGWILGKPFETHQFMLNDKLWEVQARKPNVGELGCYAWAGPSKYCKGQDGKEPNLVVFAHWLIEYTRIGKRKPVDQDYLDKAYIQTQTPVWVTFVELNARPQ